MSVDGTELGVNAMGIPRSFIISPGGAAPTPHSNPWDGVSDCVIANGCFIRTNSGSWTDFSPKLVFSYNPDEGANFYLSYARGFKSGGYPAAAAVPALLIELEPETSDSYELGVKADVGEGTARINFSMFYNTYENIQLQQFGNPSPASRARYGLCPDPDAACFGVFSTINAAEAEARGIELEILWVPTPEFTLNSSFTFFDGEYTSEQLIFTGASVKGVPLLQSPRRKWDIGMSYRIEQEDQSSITVSLDANSQSEVRADLTNAAAVYDPYTLAHARLVWTSAEQDVNLSFWVRNIFDEDYLIHAYNIGGNSVQGVRGLPRMSGVTFEYKY